jgi:hypothetical protein
MSAHGAALACGAVRRIIPATIAANRAKALHLQRFYRVQQSVVFETT